MRAAIGRIAEVIPPGAVLDVGAGTGILTGGLSRAGREMVAVEPLEEMLAQLSRALGSVPAVAAVAEALPFRPDAFSGMTVAQAFHWMDHGRVLTEARRVLSPEVCWPWFGTCATSRSPGSVS
ncbi:MAG: class I SAM-dependent methyltransferase [Microthrixaceae bacterium]|nr:class I SAM-dependent methyltransferase [Microthrixaceae bacterium]